METTTPLLLVGVLLLAAPLLGSSAAVGAEEDGFSVEFIHRDSVKSPFHDPALTPHGRALAAARRSAARAAELHHLLARRSSGAPSPGTGAGVVAEVVSRQFEYLMAIEVGTPPVRVLAIADTGSDLVWVKCKGKDNDNNSNSTFFSDSDDGEDSPPPSDEDSTPPPSDDSGDAPAPSADDTPAPPSVYFVPSASSTYGRVGCDTKACRALSSAASCSPDGSCEYLYSYGDGSRASGQLSTETFTFSTIADSSKTNSHGNNNNNSSSHGQVEIAKLDFGCSTTTTGTFRADGLVGLGGGPVSLASQLGATTSLGRKFSYCLAPYANTNASSALNFGSRAVVSEPGAASTPLITGEVETYYTIALDSINVAGTKRPTTAAQAQPKYYKSKARGSGSSSSNSIIVDSGTTLTYLDSALLTPLVKDLTRRIKLPRAESPEKILDLCYDISGVRGEDALGIPDVTLVLGGGGEVTLKPDNTFVVVQEGVLCLALVATSERQSVSILGNIAQQNLHVGYDLEKGTVTFAAADCAKSHPYGEADV
ncbi:aspartic proteinase CDR1 [Brachypodium distachyon]|uniref:Peptidase A1 domain-containing protein n=1 Tax=Brachypodium distachyon TaxID=15368 RepID=I1HCL7_BRADI|nr:aspartic proteinase CDR1 [Brachypodium distachyon]KQK03000.1 hypothetical protein BRADI_2g04920v3 [Brachypodium distachyon]|eukprot:XP_024314015.1 aspartic proteinase CDR1 [Brachypodium distachyon]